MQQESRKLIHLFEAKIFLRPLSVIEVCMPRLRLVRLGQAVTNLTTNHSPTWGRCIYAITLQKKQRPPHWWFWACWAWATDELQSELAPPSEPPDPPLGNHHQLLLRESFEFCSMGNLRHVRIVLNPFSCFRNQTIIPKVIFFTSSRLNKPTAGETEAPD